VYWSTDFPSLHPDDTGNAPTIQAAIDSVAPGSDIIELTDGVYTSPGNRDLINYEKLFVVRSQSGDPSACIIDVEGDPTEHHWGFVFSGLFLDCVIEDGQSRGQ